MAIPVPRNILELIEEGAAVAAVIPRQSWEKIVRWRNPPGQSPAQRGRDWRANPREAVTRSNRALKAEIRQARAAKHREREQEAKFDRLLLVEDEPLAA